MALLMPYFEDFVIAREFRPMQKANRRTKNQKRVKKTSEKDQKTLKWPSIKRGNSLSASLLWILFLFVKYKGSTAYFAIYLAFGIVLKINGQKSNLGISSKGSI